MDISNLQVGQNFAATPINDVPLQQKPVVAPIDKDNGDNNTAFESDRDSAQNAQVPEQTVDNVITEQQEQSDIEAATREVESFLQVQNRNLAFSVDEETNRSVVTVKDSASGDVIRQIPTDEVLRLAERIKNLQEDIGSSVGMLVNNKV
ncbi:flagellar protein FlaG [Alteromonas sp. C1M14]|uniref:flagellar protein FlaG n=1 Tax=Alteromonas sp. C1M14 TaxID=2841567 RepID=UPI001C08F151|nr:flagellar protein FlaG [Alteromonas sp. C1M14]